MTMLECIHEQPKVLKRTIEGRKELAASFSDEFSAGSHDCIYLVASGTSRNASLAAAPFMEEMLGIPVFVETSAGAGRYFGSPLVLFISQSGNSTNTIKAAEGCHYPSFAITGNAAGRVNSICRHHVLLQCGDETVGPKTKGYTATVALLDMLALEAGRRCGRIDEAAYAALVDGFIASADAMEANIAASAKWVASNMTELEKATSFYLIGKGSDQAIAAEGALKIMETLLVPAASFEFEEYLHGPICSLEEGTGGIYLMPEADDEDRGRVEKLFSIHGAKSSAVFSVCGEAEASFDGTRLCLAASDKWFQRPFSYMLPLQLISAMVPIDRGIDGVGSKRFYEIDADLGMKAKN